MTTDGRRRRLTPEMILATAIEVRESGGEDAFSLRRVAAAVPCDAMSVSHHFGSRSGLERALGAWIDDQVTVPTDGDWRHRLTVLADGYRAVALQYPQTFPLLQRFLYTGTDYGTSEVVHRAVADAGVPPARIPAVTLGWFSCVIGLAVSEVQGLVAPLDDAGAAALADLPEDRFPLTRSLAEEYRALDTRAVFTTTVQVLHDGIERVAT